MSISILGILLIVILAIAPLIIGILLIVNSRGRGLTFPSCGSCGYDVSGTVGTATRCPECGKEFLVVGILPPRGRRNPIMLWTGILILLIPFTCVGISGVLHLTARQRMATAQQAAVAAQAQAIAAQAAQANALFLIPAPLSVEQINKMTPEEASAATAKVSAALNRNDLTAVDSDRLKREFNLLAQRSGNQSPPTPNGR